ncbi:MAG: Poly (3-hydroxybutyrate) depolymerase [Steroidobacteraceae bacterium]|nr:Poly (3-hydroxybutyrate) depolymerase [Steroidobacteraceae bacterium]
MKRRASRATRVFATALLVAGIVACGERSWDAARSSDRLAAVPVAADSVTVSGFSAGGYMAVQFHVAHSSLVRGAGIFAAGPYYCAGNSLGDALGRCMRGDGDISADELASLTSQLALDGEIDPIAGLADDRVFLWHGSADEVVVRPVVDALQAYYATLVAPDAIERVELDGAAHTLPADDPSLAACDVTAEPFVGHCRYAGARRMLEHLYGPFGARSGPLRAGKLHVVDQSPYGAATGAAGLSERGWLYVPAACAGTGAPGRCRLHVVFHGCRQGASYVDDVFVRRSGYLAAADAGNVVVLFPQVEPSFQPLNPNGCWDWWGYVSDAYATRRGPQVVAIKAMVDDLLGAAAAEKLEE